MRSSSISKKNDYEEMRIDIDEKKGEKIENKLQIILLQTNKNNLRQLMVLYKDLVKIDVIFDV